MSNRKIKIKFLGVFEKAYGSGEIKLKAERNEKLIDLIYRLAESSPELGRLLIDPELKNPRPNAIILVNGKELSVLKKGLETLVKNNDEVVFIPVIHGG
jgi:molybdopterin converting factor small subunit